MTKIKVCDLCRKNEPEWAMQLIENELRFSVPGWHYRGFKVIKVCDDCKNKIKSIDTAIAANIWNTASGANQP